MKVLEDHQIRILPLLSLHLGQLAVLLLLLLLFSSSPSYSGVPLAL